MNFIVTSFLSGHGVHACALGRHRSHDVIEKIKRRGVDLRSAKVQPHTHTRGEDGVFVSFREDDPGPAVPAV